MPAPEKFKLKCQSVRENDNYFSMFFNDGSDVPSFLVRLPKVHLPYEEGRVYLITIEEAPTNGA